MNDKLTTITNLFEGKEIRSIWDSEKEEYYFSVVDVINSLAEPKDASDYWTTLKRRMIKEEKSEIPTNCRKLKMKSSKDGKMYKTDTLDTEGIFRLIESVPSSKAEPFKMWLASLGKEIIDEVFDPEIATRELAKEHKPFGLEQNKRIAKMGGSAAKAARDNIEKNIGRTVISNKNSLNYEYIDEKLLEEKKGADPNE